MPTVVQEGQTGLGTMCSKPLMYAIHHVNVSGMLVCSNVQLQIELCTIEYTYLMIHSKTKMQGFMLGPNVNECVRYM